MLSTSTGKGKMFNRYSLLILILFTVTLAAQAIDVPESSSFEIASNEPQVASRSWARADTLFLFTESGEGSFGSPGTDARGFTFDHEGGPAPAGWRGVDMNDEGSFWHVASTDICAGTGTDMSQSLPFDPEDTENDFALWCGYQNDNCDFRNQWDNPQGYGNNWDQFAILDLGPHDADSVTIRFTWSWHVEGEEFFTYDIVTFELWVNDEWHDYFVAAVTGPVYIENDLTFPAEILGDGDWRMAFRFQSDGGASDEDGGHLSDVGAVWVDNIEVIADETTIFTADFEDGLVPPEISFESADDSAGDFAQLHQGLYQGIADPVNDSFVWAFFDSLTPAVGSPGHEFGIVYGPPYLKNAIESPPLAVDASGAPLAITDYTQVLLSFDIFVDMPIDNLIFYFYEIGVVLEEGADCPPVGFPIETYVYHGDDQDWLHVTQDITLAVQDASFGQVEAVEALIVRLAAVDMCGIWCDTFGDGYAHNQSPYIDNVRMMLVDTITDVAPQAAKPALAAFPNPFNPSTRVEFSLEEDGPADLAIYDIGGRRLRTLVSREMTAGNHELEWNGRDDDGRELAGGVYFLLFKADGVAERTKLVLLK